ncbi:MAG TPA: glycosyltransferase, partial [Terriglobia bacterium]|nr:glycosyltransferase [Terriglobia bacterium]
PTYNRKAILKRAIEAYAQQTRPDAISEVLIIDDGSTDGTGELVAQIGSESPFPVRHLYQENRGLAAARNHGIREARGDLILFGDDDVIPAPNLLEEHLAWHEKHPEPHVGVLGYLPWSPEVHPTPLMRYIIMEGPQFGYGHMTAGKSVSFMGCYFNNTSLKLDFLRQNGNFNENFRTWGCEDWDFGYRLMQKGLVMLYNPRAVGYHCKRVSFAEACQISKKIQPSLKIFEATEAGKAYFAAEKQRKSSRKYRAQLRLARWLVPILMPLKPLLDSPIPLPKVLYRAFFAYHNHAANPSR